VWRLVEGLLVQQDHEAAGVAGRAPEDGSNWEQQLRGTARLAAAPEATMVRFRGLCRCCRASI
jgi:hypothetical protein